MYTCFDALRGSCFGGMRVEVNSFNGAGGFTLPEFRNIKISGFASQLESRDYYECGHKNLTNNRNGHHDSNPKTFYNYL